MKANMPTCIWKTVLARFLLPSAFAIALSFATKAYAVDIRQEWKPQ